MDEVGAREIAKKISSLTCAENVCSCFIHTKCNNFRIFIYMMQLEGSVFRFTNRTCMSKDHVCYTWFVIYGLLNGDKPEKQ